MVLDRILVRTGLRVRTMNNSELRFKSYKAVAAREEEFQHTVKNGAALMDVGFGSTQISLFDEEVLVSTQNLLLGVLRLSEMSAHWRVDYRKIPAIIDELVENELYTFRKIFLKEHQIETLIATGETMNYMISRGMHEKRRSGRSVVVLQSLTTPAVKLRTTNAVTRQSGGLHGVGSRLSMRFPPILTYRSASAAGFITTATNEVLPYRNSMRMGCCRRSEKRRTAEPASTSCRIRKSLRKHVFPQQRSKAVSMRLHI